MSELDKVFGELAQKRTQQDQERREQQKLAVAPYQPAEKLAKKRELIGEIISFFDL
jgi:hypothetical protein